MQVSKKFAVMLGILGLAAGTAGTIAMQTHAATTSSTGTTQTTAPKGRRGSMMGTPPAAAGKVTAVSGNTITVTDQKSNTSFTVDASGATIQKFTPPTAGQKPAAPQTITVSQIAVGDTVMIQGTTSGTNITATKITDGATMFAMGGFRGGMGGHGQTGTVSAINGSTITLTGKNGTTYTVDASNSAVEKISTASVSAIAVGDTLEVNGTSTGSTITAKNIVDGQLGQKK